MFDLEQYQLLDFGAGRKLESVSGTIVDRLSPAADGASFDSPSDDCLRFANDSWNGNPPSKWMLEHGRIKFLLKLTPFGHVGVFPEQATNWDWIRELPGDLSGCSAINLFAHTGGTTMALADRGASVVHVDSAKNVVNWARENAAAAGLSDSPIRWIVDDAMKFLNRELKRGKKYDFIVADPPSFGHGLKKSSWKFDRDLPQLMNVLSQLSSPNLVALLLTCHTTGYTGANLLRDTRQHFDFLARKRFSKGSMSIKQAGSDRRLRCGHYVRWSAS